MAYVIETIEDRIRYELGARLFNEIALGHRIEELEKENQRLRDKVVECSKEGCGDDKES